MFACTRLSYFQRYVKRDVTRFTESVMFLATASKTFELRSFKKLIVSV